MECIDRLVACKACNVHILLTQPTWLADSYVLIKLRLFRKSQQEMATEHAAAALTGAAASHSVHTNSNGVTACIVSTNVYSAMNWT
jgi:hypothetical protein